ncbi:hypothetical protein DERP_003207 [Dermatophagoides pteronyssinus]|uniref:BTB domain-containing protein n=1 Tax=Dermatophagoides pteronyssinus TaxID=6956 RepID=A0ABQ8JJL0_DERPT|nr:hypothetical protein DERP_003207 [Dermatophagoides pteronyssinus]
MIQIRLNENENKLREFFIDSYRKKILTDCVIYCHCLKDDDYNSGNVGDHNKTSSMQRDDISSTETLNLLIDNNDDHHQELDEKYLKFDCHRLILSLYSKFFHHYFCNHHHNDDNNNRQQSMSIFIDIPAKIMDDLLKIIYFGSITIDNEERKLAIISAAFKLGVSSNDNQTKRIAIDQTTTTTTMLYTCQYCQKQYNYEISLKKHVKSAHS